MPTPTPPRCACGALAIFIDDDGTPQCAACWIERDDQQAQEAA